MTISVSHKNAQSRGWAERAPYELNFEPDNRSWTARENLTDILERELLGPAGGDEEILDGPPDVAYLVGRIAPVRLTGGPVDPVEEGSEEAATDVGDAVAASESRGVPVTAVDDSTADADEDDVDDDPQKRGLMVPASMGLRFQIPLDCASFTVTASWGVYKSMPGEEPGTTRYKRTPVDIPVVVEVAQLKARETTTFPLMDDVVLRVDQYEEPELKRRLVEVALCNDRETSRKIPVDAWLYQTKLYADVGGEDLFLPVRDVLEDERFERDTELRRLNLQYRDRLEFAVGRTCSVDWHVAKGSRRATKVWTTWLPTSETPQTTAEEIEAATLDMTVLAKANVRELREGLEPIVTGYAQWLDQQGHRVSDLPRHLRDDAWELIEEAGQVQEQLAEGLEHLLSNEEALRCFRFMNAVMADQRIQTQVASDRATDSSAGIFDARQKVLARGPLAHSWRTFQLAFILMQLPLLTDPASTARSGDLAKAQLLFFPTGGGKTEAYLGLAAYTFAMRRRQGIVTTADGELNGLSGVAVLMRYTLRLLTAQQFQRATALVCAAEMVRRADPEAWGAESFRIGLWVGTDVSPKRFDEAEKQVAKANDNKGGRVTVLQFKRCPWCGTRITVSNVRPEKATRRVHVFCGDEFADCPFSEGGTAEEGLPVLTVDEEIYRLTPAFLIATVDKFARLAREGEAASLFGYVRKHCERHGYVHTDYRHCEIQDGNKHPASQDGGPPAAVRAVGRLRPPDLIIQDELHLITGALGTTVGLFEVGVDLMCSWRDQNGTPVQPLVVASTATVRNAADQVRALYGRDVTVFPPQVLDVGNTFFSTEREVSEEYPGRRYVGVSTTGVRLTTAEIRVAEILMAAGQLLLDRAGEVADPYLTLVGYFNATRELAGMARYMLDDVQTLLSGGRRWSSLPRRRGTDYGNLHLAELTSRVSSDDITTTLDDMAVAFDPAFDSTKGRTERAELVKAAKTPAKRDVNPFDVVLATSMLQVGVDVTRLGLMLMVGQPKNTAEYIQASSRVGRDPGRPGLVVSLGNWARPRDLAHFEQFRHYHETFYAKVEALSVTPFSATSMDRGLDGVLVSATRVLQAARASGLSPEKSAGQIDAEQDAVGALIEALTARVKRASDETSAETARNRLKNRLDQWIKRRQYLAQEQKNLVYERVTDEGKAGPLIISAENVRARDQSKDVSPFVVANSMREVQPEINLLVSPIKDRLFVRETEKTPGWQMPSGEEDAS
ncbi:helicase [Kocuria rosea]|uniref:DISARM system helicase DrmA n=1 Tax=Kocuria rosea TaxID=1275 RepID=UPI000D65C31F|nr:DISARM system helicase DrmA [Kocuria rosea]PWF84032.1 helicase [Kocuria rosea]QCY34397.1 helicase [Kocuria rosea]TQN38654.1 helicase-like protein [Kocuria rosea]